MIPSLVQPNDVDALEADLRIRLPPFYRAFLCCRVVGGFGLSSNGRIVVDGGALRTFRTRR